ncbi:sterol esterase Tgl1p [Monosporozyma unispora]|nr:cholesterol esterase [Kazachstania unispora]
MKGKPSPPPIYDNEYYKMFNRISFTDLFIVILVYIESICSFFLKLIPGQIIKLFTSIINFTANIDDTTTEEKLRSAPTIHEMCDLFDIIVEDHLVRTEDNYILTLHRIPPSSDNNNGKVVYLHHGLLMCSDVWCCQMERNKNLPFLLHDLGFDVWMGNNRGNKYSTAHLYHTPKSAKFWDFSIDEFAFFDIPNSIEFILDYTQVDKLICIGFSQGSAQMFAALSVNEYLNSKISHLIAIAPAMTPERLHNVIADTFAKSTPRLMYLFFGRNIILPSAVVWQRTTHPHLFSIIIDICNRFLFNWKSLNITPKQKEICFAKLYSTTSVKSIVHWFQILRSQKFQMFEESDDMFNSLTRPYQIANFPTRTNIKIPILLLYGSVDLLVDIKIMKKNLPPNGVFDIKVDNHEHLDLIWADDVDTLVFNKVIKFIEFFDLSSSNIINDSNKKMILPNSTRLRSSSIMNSITSINEMPYMKRRHSLNSAKLHNVISEDSNASPMSPRTQGQMQNNNQEGDKEDEDIITHDPSVQSMPSNDSESESDEPQDIIEASFKKDLNSYNENKSRQRQIYKLLSHDNDVMTSTTENSIINDKIDGLTPIHSSHS